MTATDLADFLTTRGIPFRTAHGIVQHVSEQSGGDPHKFKELALTAIKEHVPSSKASDRDVPDLENSIARRDSIGGTAPKAVASQVTMAASALAKEKKALARLKNQVSAVDKLVSG